MVFKHNRKKNKVTKELKIGDNVAINIPKIDRGHSDLSRLPGTIIAIHGKNSRLLTYTIATEYGTLADKYSMNSLGLYEGALTPRTDKTISLHSAASLASRHTVDSSISRSKCECKTGCKTNSCICKRLNKQCTTHCHLKIFKKACCTNK